MDKATLRRQIIESRRTLSMSQATEWSDQIANRLQSLIEWEAVSRLHVYRSREEWREVDTSWLVEYIGNEWPHVELTIGDVSRTAMLPSDNYDAIIVPLVAFDNDCNRLGLGGGWYDRFLETQPQALTVGLAYEMQRVAVVPTETHDVALDHVITEAGVITKSASRP